MTQLRLRLLFGASGRFGPGKADLLEQIEATGSISAAGRAMGMSYRRAWALVEAMNAMFREPLVETARGGTAGGGARVTDAGRTVLAHYRSLEAVARQAGHADLAGLEALLASD